MATFQDPRANHLLAALPEEDFGRIAAYLQPVGLKLGEMLFEPGIRAEHAYFPGNAIASLHYVTSTGASAETAGVGNEGLVGVSIFMGGGVTSSSAVVHTAGQAFRLSRDILLREFDHGGAMRRLLLSYAQALITQTTQTAICNRFHSVEQQFCRWLLLSLDRIPSGELVITQELIGLMLGVRREGITEAAGRLQAAGHIRYRRGHISVIDREGLSQRSCECYNVVKTEMNRLLGTKIPSAVS